MSVQLETKKERVNFLISKELSERVNQAAERNGITASEFFRRAIACYLDTLEKNRIAEELEAGYLANRGYYSRMSEEWKQANSE